MEGGRRWRVVVGGRRLWVVAGGWWLVVVASELEGGNKGYKFKHK